MNQKGGECPCSKILHGGYKATRKNRQLLAKVRKGIPIGFTATASLKSKGLLPRTAKRYRGKKVVGTKYK